VLSLRCFNVTRRWGALRNGDWFGLRLEILAVAVAFLAAAVVFVLILILILILILVAVALARRGASSLAPPPGDVALPASLLSLDLSLQLGLRGRPAL
jgi:hypothetical protein